MAYEPHSA